MSVETRDMRETGWEDFEMAIATIKSLQQGYDGRPRDNTREYIISDIERLKKSVESLNARKNDMPAEEWGPIGDLIVSAEDLIKVLEQK